MRMTLIYFDALGFGRVYKYRENVEGRSVLGFHGDPWATRVSQSPPQKKDFILCMKRQGERKEHGGSFFGLTGDRIDIL